MFGEVTHDKTCGGGGMYGDVRHMARQDVTHSEARRDTAWCGEVGRVPGRVLFPFLEISNRHPCR